MRIQVATILGSFAAGLVESPVASPQITPGPDLAKRQTGAIETCGYISGQANSPLTCPSGFTCTNDGVAGNFFACCDDFKSCTSDWHTCANFGEASLGEICSGIYTSCLNCGADLPFCATYKRYFSTGASSPLTSIFCAATATVITALVHADGASSVTSGMSVATSGTSLVTSGTSVVTSGASSLDTTGPTLGPTTTPTSTTPTTTPTASSGGLTVGDQAGIAGAVVGAIAIFSGLIGIAFPHETRMCLSYILCCSCGRRSNVPTYSTGPIPLRHI